MIRLGKEEPFIKAKGLEFGYEQNSNIKLPKVAIGVFSKQLFNDIIQKFNCKEIGRIHNVNFDKKVFLLKYKDQVFSFFIAGVGGPVIAMDIEILHAQGVEKIIIFGNCGVLDSNIKDCSIVIPNLAYREEGTSYHYVQDNDTIEVNPKYKEEFVELLKEYKFDYTIGSTWTTDAFFRETLDKIRYFKSLNVKVVDMESASIAAVCKYLCMDYFTFYYAGDNLDGVEWDVRSFEELSNLDKKKEVALLALELAVKINN